MKKFSELSNKPTVEESTNKKDFIQNLVEQSLTIVEGEIQGKEVLVEALNKIIALNDSKTKIQVLESVKVNAYRGGFDFNLISKAIEMEKEKLNAPPIEEEKKERDIFLAQPNDRIVSVRESVETDEEVEVIEESEKGEWEVYDDETNKTLLIVASSLEEAEEIASRIDYNEYEDGDLIKEAKDEDDEEEMTGEKAGEKKLGEEGIDDECDECDKKDEEDEEDEEVIEESVDENSAIQKVTYVITDEMRNISDLASLCEGIITEHHAETKKEKIEFILDNSKLDDESGPKRKKELENMSDKEIDGVYNKLEKDLGMVD